MDCVFRRRHDENRDYSGRMRRRPADDVVLHSGLYQLDLYYLADTMCRRVHPDQNCNRHSARMRWNAGRCHGAELPSTNLYFMDVFVCWDMHADNHWRYYRHLSGPGDEQLSRGLQRRYAGSDHKL